MQHAVAGQALAIDLKVTGLEYACIFFHLLKVRIHTTLAGLMGNGRNVDVMLLALVPHRRRNTFVNGDSSLLGYVRHIELIGSHVRSGGGSGIQMTVVQTLPIADQILEHRKITLILITVAIQQERRMIAVFPQNGSHFIFKECAPLGTFAHVLDPHRQLCL